MRIQQYIKDMNLWVLGIITVTGFAFLITSAILFFKSSEAIAALSIAARQGLKLTCGLSGAFTVVIIGFDIYFSYQRAKGNTEKFLKGMILHNK